MKLFIFDMGDVILLDVRTLMKISEYTGASYRSIREDYGYYDRALMDGYMDASDYYRHLEDKYSVRIESDLFSDFFTPHVNEHLIDIVDRLRSAGHRCVIGSNTFAPHWRLALAFPGRPLDHFDALYASHLMHMSKPEPAFWRMISEKRASAIAICSSSMTGLRIRKRLHGSGWMCCSMPERIGTRRRMPSL